MEILEYPNNVSDTGFFIQFQFYDRMDVDKLIINTYNKIKGNSKNNNKIKGDPYDGCGKKKEKVTVNDDIVKGTVKTANTIVTKTLLSELVLINTINLYIPSDMNPSNSVDIAWNFNSSGSVGAIISELDNNGGDIMKAIKANDVLLADKGIKTLLNRFTSNEMQEMYDKVKSTLGQIHGVKPKKDDELLYLEGITPRVQSINFRFVPKSKEEYEIVKKITETFILNAYPDLISSGIKYPPVVQMRLYFNNKLVLGFKHMQIENINVPFMPEGFQVYSDGNPAIIDMSVTLKENGKYYKKHYVEDAKRIYKKSNK